MGSGRIVALVVLSLATVVSAIGCGGTSVRRGSGDETGGTGGTGAAGTGGIGAGGSGIGAEGGTGSGAQGGTGGTDATGGSGAVGGCTNEPPCLPLECPDGRIGDTPCGCPVCSCEGLTCVSADCPAGQIPTRLPGACCDSCIDAPPLPGCENVMCLAETECPSDRVWARPAGACCEGCIPLEPAACPEIACPPDLTCPAGYTRGDLLGGCCFECLPNPDYCQRPVDCLVVKRVTDCCGCEQAVSVRHYEEDLCLSGRGLDRPIPPECGTPKDCEEDCVCEAVEDAWCSSGTCIPFDFAIK